LKNTFVSVASQATLDGYRNSFISIPRGDMSRGNSFAALSFHRGSIVASHLSIPREIRRTSLSEHAGELELEPAKPIWTALKEMTNCHLLVNKYFMLIAISNVFGMLGFYVPFVYLPNMAVLKNVSIENANFLLSIIGISNTLGDFNASKKYFINNRERLA
jgi:MCP family monocarboxylic acid transporter-like MFS transporter 14